MTKKLSTQGLGLLVCPLGLGCSSQGSRYPECVLPDAGC